MKLYQPVLPRGSWEDPSYQISPFRPEGVEWPVHDNGEESVPFSDQPEPKRPESLEEWATFANFDMAEQIPLRALDNVVRKGAKDLERVWQAEEKARAYKSSAIDLDDFLGEEEEAPDWIIPGLLERDDRIILTGRPGSGKSVISRQVAICAASGIHPFDLNMIGMRPVKVLYVDLENPETLTRRKLRELRACAARKYVRGNLTIVSKPDGMDLVGNDGAELRAEIEAAGGTDLVVIGPLYKMVTSGDVVEEPVARELVAALDKLRVEYGFALWIEAHPPHSELDKDGVPRIIRPYGASLFTRWPEFGYFLHYDADNNVGELIPWRPDRQEGRRYPQMLRRGGKWPWTDPGAEADTVWLRMADVCEKHATKNRGQMPSQRKLAEALNVSASTVNHWISVHRDRWDTLKTDLVNRYGPQPDVSAGQEQFSDRE